jgi:hypothetical protein
MTIRCYYSVVRYVPDDLRDEAINIGVIVEPQGPEKGTTRICSFSANFSRAARLDQSLDRRTLDNILRSSIERLSTQVRTQTLQTLVERYSGGQVQLTGPRLSYTDNIQNELKQLKEKFVVELAPTRELGFTEPRLRQEVKDVLRHRLQSWRPDVVKFSGKGKKLVYAGKLAGHEFDFAFESAQWLNVFRCITFDVKGYAEKISETKVLAYDARDIKDAQRPIQVSSVLYPPKHHVNGNVPAIYEAEAILKREGIGTFDFSKEDDRNGLVTIAETRIREVPAPTR